MKWIKLNLGSKKRFSIAIGAVLLIALVGFRLWGGGASAAEYMTAKVERGNLRNSVTATGTLQAVTTVQVGSQSSGTISALYADFNSTVKKGQVIAQLDPSTTQAQVEQARANVIQARAALAQAQAGVAQSRAGISLSRAGVTDAQGKALAARSTVQNQQAGVAGAQANLAVLKAQMDDASSFLRQQESLAVDGVVARRDVETAQTSYKTAEARYNQAVTQVQQAVLSAQSSSSAGIVQSQAQVQQAQAQVQQSQAQAQNSTAQVQNAAAQVQQAEAALQLAQINLSHTTITSPIDGVVVSRNVDVGQTVAASLSAPTLFTIANDLTQMQVIANIDQADIGLVEQAKSVNFTVDAFPGEEYQGTIQQMRLNPQNVQNVVTYNVVIDVSNPKQKLKPGMTANLTITIDERNNVLKVPNAALRFTPQATTGQQAATTQATTGNASGQDSRQGARQRAANASNANAASVAGAPADNGAQPSGSPERRIASPTSPVLSGQMRRIWVLGQDGQPQSREIQVGLTDGAATEVVEGNLQEGEIVITGQNITGQSKPQSNQTAPGFGGAPRGGGAPAGGGRRG
ncbi:MAG TPA: efflux RND transporter periplasmic adaptor subunit [Pyrinomonadaceae bacterium]|jgi:HlyD family secretion protein|nr:efflux RND transporter periplasmic adaptor subunit [Pyrinomonadaceae bacterium]